MTTTTARKTSRRRRRAKRLAPATINPRADAIHRGLTERVDDSGSEADAAILASAEALAVENTGWYLRTVYGLARAERDERDATETADARIRRELRRG